jgi:hypothetical protein
MLMNLTCINGLNKLLELQVFTWMDRIFQKKIQQQAQESLRKYISKQSKE